MHRSLLTTIAMFASFIATTSPSSSSAQQPVAHDPVAAEALFRDARDAFKKGDYASACPKFAESQRLDPATGTLFNLADCEERAGKLASAWQHWRDVIDATRTNPSDERHALATQHVTALDSRLPRLRIRWARGAFPTAVVKRDGVELGSMSMEMALPTDPGSHTIDVTAPGRKPMSYTVQAVESKTTDVEIGVGDPTEPAKPEVTPDPTNQPRVTDPNAHTDNSLVVPERGSGGSSALPILGVVSMVIGGGLGIVGIATGSIALGDKSTVDTECNAAKLCTMKGVSAAHDGSSMATVSTVTLIIGGVLIVGGLVLVIAGSGGKSSKAARIPLWVQGRF